MHYDPEPVWRKDGWTDRRQTVKLVLHFLLDVASKIKHGKCNNVNSRTG